MNAYYIHYYRDFGNTYCLYYAPVGTPVPPELERITRAQAEQKCRDERLARKYDPNFSGYGDTYIYPLSSRGKDIERIKPSRGYIVREDEIICY